MHLLAIYIVCGSSPIVKDGKKERYTYEIGIFNKIH